jgi:hypothetical protein
MAIDQVQRAGRAWPILSNAQNGGSHPSLMVNSAADWDTGEQHNGSWARSRSTAAKNHLPAVQALATYQRTRLPGKVTWHHNVIGPR